MNDRPQILHPEHARLLREAMRNSAEKNRRHYEAVRASRAAVTDQAKDFHSSKKKTGPG